MMVLEIGSKRKLKAGAGISDAETVFSFLDNVSAGVMRVEFGHIRPQFFPKFQPSFPRRSGKSALAI